MSSKKLKVEYWDADTIYPYENNPRNNDSAVLAVKSSIKEFGFVNPILVDGYGVIIAGHTRYKAGVDLGMKQMPVIQDKELTEKEVQVLRIIDNSTASIASWDRELLDLEMGDLEGFDFELYGLDSNLMSDEEVEDVDGFFDQTQDLAKPGGGGCVVCPKCGHQFAV